MVGGFTTTYVFSAYHHKRQNKQKGLLPLTPKPVNLKYASSSSLAFGISDTTTGCNSKLVVSQDPSVGTVMPKGELKLSWRTSEGGGKCSSR